MPKANTATLQNQGAAKRGRGTQATIKKIKIESNNSPTKSAATEPGTEMPAAEEAVDKVFYVQELIGKRICNGIVQYKIRWVGYGEEDDTWEYIDNCHCPDAIDKFEEENADLVPEQIEIDDMMKKRQSNSSQGRKMKKRGRKSKIATTEAATTNLDEAVEFVPFVEKEHYRVMDEDAVVSQIIGMRQMGNVDVVGADKKVMALVVYAEDGIHEYVPLEELRKNPSGIQLLLDFFIVRMQMIG